LSVAFEQAIANYTAGETYDISVSLEEADIERFGFSLSVLDENNNKAGQLMVTDAQRTQIIEGVLDFTGREYVTYRMIGTNPYETGKGFLSFKWIAPESSVGKVTFYVAGVSANNDGTDKGDLVYTKTLELEGNPLSINSFQDNKIAVFPNPVKNTFQVQFNDFIDETMIFFIYNSEGKQVSDLLQRKISSDGKTITFFVDNLQPNIYFLKATSNTVSTTKKLLLIN
jgi:hypothetical protein